VPWFIKTEYRSPEPQFLYSGHMPNTCGVGITHNQTWNGAPDVSGYPGDNHSLGGLSDLPG
jgi:hypothetical protein